jgi:hypothetical protein
MAGVYCVVSRQWIVSLDFAWESVFEALIFRKLQEQMIEQSFLVVHFGISAAFRHKLFLFFQSDPDGYET